MGGSNTLAASFAGNKPSSHDGQGRQSLQRRRSDGQSPSSFREAQVDRGTKAFAGNVQRRRKGRQMPPNSGHGKRLPMGQLRLVFRQTPSHGVFHSISHIEELLTDFLSIGKNELRRRGRSGRPKVRRPVAQRRVDVVPHPADDRDGAGAHGPHHPLVVEGNQVLPASAAPHQKRAVEMRNGRHPRKRPHDIFRRVHALHLRAHQDNLADRITAPRHLNDVQRRGSRLRRDHRHLPGIRGQRSFQIGRKQALFFEAFLEFLTSPLHRAGSHRHKAPRVKLIDAALRVETDASFNENAVSVTGPLGNESGVLLKNSASDPALFTQKVEITMAARVFFELGYFSSDDNRFQRGVGREKPLNIESQLVNGQLRSRKPQLHFCRPHSRPFRPLGPFYPKHR